MHPNIGDFKMKTRISIGSLPAILCILAFPAFALSASGQAIDPSPYTFSTVAMKSGTQHFNPKSVAVDAAGRIYFADAKNQVICRIEPSGTVSIIAGEPGTCGSRDGKGCYARFRYPRGIATDAAGNIYVADTCNNTIRRITPGGVVTTLAGLAGTAGSADGTAFYARFNYPTGVAVDHQGKIYVADLYNCTIRKVTADGTVTTIAGLAEISGSTDGRGALARFRFPMSVAVDDSGNIYVADLLNNAIRKVTPTGMVITWAGTMSYTPGNADGMGKGARFNHPSGVAVDKAGNIYVADSCNDTIRRISPDQAVTTLAGLAGQSGFADGTGNTVRFWHPTNLAVDCPGNLYVTDLDNAAIRKGFVAASTKAALSLKTASAPRAHYPE